MSGGTIQSTAMLSGAAVILGPDANMSMSGGSILATLKSDTTGQAAVVKVLGNSTLTMSGGTITATNNRLDGVFVDSVGGEKSTANLTISGGTISGYRSAINLAQVAGTDQLNLIGGVLTGESAGILVGTNSEATIHVPANSNVTIRCRVDTALVPAKFSDLFVVDTVPDGESYAIATPKK